MNRRTSLPEVAWEVIYYHFTYDWVFDPEFGWVPFSWFPEALHPQRELFEASASPSLCT